MRPVASHPPPGLVAAGDTAPVANVVTSSAATKDLRAAFGFDAESDDEDQAPAEQAPQDAATLLPPPAPKPEPAPKTEPAPDVAASQRDATADATNAVGANAGAANGGRRFHWLQLEASPTRPGISTD